MSARRPTGIRRSAHCRQSFRASDGWSGAQEAIEARGRGHGMTVPRLFPMRLDNEGYRGHVAALWLFGLFVLLRSIMGVNGAINTTAIDRKSTRLNSSHLVISYGVFCLKKKNTNK